MAGPYDAHTVINLDFGSSPQRSTASPQPSQATANGDTQDPTAAPVTNAAPEDDGPERAATPTRPPSQTAASTAGFTPMRRGQVHGLDDSPRNRQEVSARKERATLEMQERGRAVEAMRSGTFKQPAQRKRVAGGDVVKDSAIPVWGGRPTAYSKERAALAPKDPFERAMAQCVFMREAESASKSNAKDRGLPKPLTMGPRQSSVARGKQREQTRRDSPPPVASSSTRPPAQAPGSTRSEPWRPFTQYLPHQRLGRESDGDDEFPHLPTKKNAAREPPASTGRIESRRNDARPAAAPTRRPDFDYEAEERDRELEIMNEEAARRIQEQLWAKELAYNRSRRSQSHADEDDPMDRDDFDDEEEDAEVLASDSDEDRADGAGYDSFEDISDVDSPGDDEEQTALLNIEPALGDDRAKAAARANIFADTKARIRWSPATHEPIAGMTQAKLVAGIDPTQLQQHIGAAASIDHVYIGIVHAVGGTKSADIDRVTLVTALDTMISLTCREGTSVLFSAARQDQNGPRLRPGTVLIDTANEELGALWQESAHWAQAGVRITIQKYRQDHSAFMVTLEGTRRNKQSVAHGVRSAAKKLPALKNVFRQYNALYPGKGRPARDNLIKSIVARPMSLTSRKALGFGTVQYNIFARLHERDPDADPSTLTGNDEVDGYPALSAEMHWAVRDAFQLVGIVDGRLGDATPITTPWDCAFCFAESHPVGKCELKDVEGWFKPYEDFLAVNLPHPEPGRGKQDKGKAKAGPPKNARAGPNSRGGGGGGRASGSGRGNGGTGRGGPPRAGPSRATQIRRHGGA